MMLNYWKQTVNPQTRNGVTFLVFGLAVCIGFFAVWFGTILEISLWVLLTLVFGLLALLDLRGSSTIYLLLLALFLGEFTVEVFGKTPQLPVVYLLVPMSLVSSVLLVNFANSERYRIQNKAVMVWIFYLVSLVPSVILSQDIGISLLRYMDTIMAFLVYLLVRKIYHIRKIESVVVALVLWGGGVALRYIWHLVIVVGLETALNPFYRGQVNELPNFGKSNYMASLFILLIFPALALIFSRKHFLIRAISLGAMLTMLFGLVLTFSRGGFVATGAGAILFFWLNRSSGVRFRYIMLIGVLLLFILVGGTDLLEVTKIRFIERDWSGRLLIWNHAFKLFLSHWLIGVGFGVRLVIPILGDALFDTHNIVLGTLMESGIVGFTGFATLIGFNVNQIFKRMKALTSQSINFRLLRAGLFTSILASLIHSLVEPTFRGASFLIIFWIIMSLTTIVEPNV